MSAPDGLDPVLWQQAVEAAAKAIRRTSLGDQYPRLATTVRWQDYKVDAEAALSAVFWVLQQATRAQIPAELRQMASDYERGGYEETAGYAAYFASVFDGRVARGETP